MSTNSFGSDLLFGEAISVWIDLERALAGTNGYGGNVAEIYAYRLVPGNLLPPHSAIPPEQQAQIAATNLTAILRRFIETHNDIEIALEINSREFAPFDIMEKPIEPFEHRIHIQVSDRRKLQMAFASDLAAVWHRAHEPEIEDGLPTESFTAWSGATKDLLLDLGMVWNHGTSEYVFDRTLRKARKSEPKGG